VTGTNAPQNHSGAASTGRRAHVYVYYRVAPEAADALRAAAVELLRRVHQDTGIGGRLMVRAEDPTTWMEVYEQVGDIDLFRLALERAVEGQAAWTRLEAGRHVECFLE